MKKKRRNGGLFDPVDGAPASEGAALTVPAASESQEADRAFYEHPGPLYAAIISPASAVVKVHSETSFRCIPRDRSHRTVEDGVAFAWRIKEGEGSLSSENGEMTTLKAPDRPGLIVVQVTVRQGELQCAAESLVTVTDSLVESPKTGDKPQDKGLPGYTFQRSPGELWRSRFDEKNNLVVINNGHRDYVYASQQKPRKLKYICRLLCQGVSVAQFPGL